MAVSFSNVPRDLVPGFKAERRTKRNVGVTGYDKPSCLVGQMRSSGTATAGVAYRVLSLTHGWALFGAGSCLGAMCEAYFLNDPRGELWAIGLADNGSGTAASGSIALSGTATESGTIALLFGTRRVEIPVASGAAAADVAADMEDYINAGTNIPVTGSTTTATCAITSRHKGTLGNGVKVYVDPNIPAPAGLTVSITQMTSGATNPTATGAVAVGEQAFDAFGLWLGDDTTMDAWEALIEARWGSTVLKFGKLFACLGDSVSDLITAGEARDFFAECLFGITGAYSAPYEFAAAAMGACMARLRLDKAANLRGIHLKGVRGPDDGANVPVYDELSLMLNAGIAPLNRAANGDVVIERPRTTYKLDETGTADPTYRDIQTAACTEQFLRVMKATCDDAMSGAKLADDDATFGGGGADNIQTPKTVRARINASYAALHRAGMVEDPEGFDAELVVERDEEDTTRLNVVFPPNYVNQYLITGAVVEVSN